MDMDDAKGASQHYTQAMAIREKALAGNRDPHKVTRQVQLLRSKLARAKAQILEHSMTQDGDRSDEDGEELAHVRRPRAVPRGCRVEFTARIHHLWLGLLWVGRWIVGGLYSESALWKSEPTTAALHPAVL